MIRIKLTVFIQKQELLNRVVETLGENFSEELEIYGYTDKDLALKSLAQYGINFFLADSDVDFEKDDVPKMCELVYFSESKNINKIKGHRAICIFQKPELIYNELLEIFAENSPNALNNIGGKENKSNVYSFVSPIGGVGTSTVAAAFAIYLARYSRKVLFVSFEKNGDISGFFSGDGNTDLGDIFYDIKSRKSNLAVRVESKIKKDETGVYFVDSCRNPLDILSIDEKDIKLFIETLSELKLFDDIVVDMDCTMDQRFLTMVNLSDNTIVVHDGKELSNLKFLRFASAMAALEINNQESYLSKMCIFLNKYSSSNGTFENETKWTLLGGLGDYYGEETFQIMQRLVNSSVFDYFFFSTNKGI